MNVLVTGGAGFIGRWVVKQLLEQGANVWVLDNLDNGEEKNLGEFKANSHFKQFVKGDVRDKEIISALFKNKLDSCVHLAAQINVQDSIENPKKAFDANVVGAFNILEEARKYNTKVIIVGTCMVYGQARKAIDEEHGLKPLSPYAASKLIAENWALSYYYSYKLPVVVLRPFNTYGPFQKSNTEGGVVSIFVSRNLQGKTLNVFGDGKQTRDLLYVEDCADFIVKAAFSKKAVGQLINAGLGKDISINDLALLIAKDPRKIKHVLHPHPQAEIKKLLCGCSKAKKLLNWEPKTSLEEGIKKTGQWFKNA